MLNNQLNELLRKLPAVHSLLNAPQGQTLVDEYGHALVVEACNVILGAWRDRISAGSSGSAAGVPEVGKILNEVGSYLSSYMAPRLKRVVNGTGIILHTNLGRAVISQKATEALIQAAACYTNLEYDLQSGERGSRHAHVEELLVNLTGAESAMVVNNNAAAVLLTMNTLAAGKEVIVSRGELVEIGGSFRVPEVLKMGGVTLVEVGTTNRTHPDDYKKAVGPNTGLILKVHTSNFRISGFTKAVPRLELRKLADSYGLPLVEDLGSGTLLDLAAYGLRDEAPVPQVLAEGVDVVTFSGDKLLGGPQAGIIAGKKKYIKAMMSNQLSRALRVDKFTLAALEATLREYLRREDIFKNVPIYQMLTIPLQELQEKAGRIAGMFTSAGDRVIVCPRPTTAEMGGGSVPGQGIPSWGIEIGSPYKTAEEIEQAFRGLPVPVIGYIDRERFVVDLRTLLPGDEDIIIQGIQKLIVP